jgi:hypothetical protein
LAFSHGDLFIVQIYMVFINYNKSISHNLKNIMCKSYTLVNNV